MYTMEDRRRSLTGRWAINPLNWHAILSTLEVRSEPLMLRRFCRPVLVVVFLSVLQIYTMWAQNAAGPQPVPAPSAVPAPVDQPYTGTISLSVDLMNVNDRVLNVRETIPVKSGDITLLYPQWLPGTHSPSN